LICKRISKKKQKFYSELPRLPLKAENLDYQRLILLQKLKGSQGDEGNDLHNSLAYYYNNLLLLLEESGPRNINQ
jgi:hypothetical protein